MAQNRNGIINESQMSPQPENKLGSDCSGVDGAADRTLTLAKSSVYSTFIITVNGTGLHEGAGKDFTASGNVITFLNAVNDTDNIRIVYFS